MLNEKLEMILKLIDEMKGLDTVSMDVGRQCSWADYMVITTTTSFSHMKGILKRLKELFYEQGWDIMNRNGFTAQEDWTLMDSNDVIIHLMSSEAREFYELENLWFDADKKYQSSSSS